MEELLYDELLVELQCPICTEYMIPPIRQCSTGHSVCEICRKKLPKCALCQGKFTESRNITLEGLAVKMRYPCVNKEAGCTAKLQHAERESHKLQCPFKVYKCQVETCSWTGKLEEIPNHWASKKMSSKPYGKSNICHTKLKSGSYYVNMVAAYNRLFWFKCKQTKSQLFWAVQLIGDSAEAENYFYMIELIKPEKSKKKIILSDYCQAINLNDDQLFKNDVCVGIDTGSVASFLNENQLIIHYLRVYVVKDEKPAMTDVQEVSNPFLTAIKVEKPSQGSSKPPQQTKKLKNHPKNQNKKSEAKAEKSDK